ncbi:ATP-binding protein [Neobacillus sp. DY30]|uniref:ATP-binding protein n=1 Tax=Neobacillus sp. DY30 TaxID=3047871 RepID=UPI0024BF4D0A|nr:ATP-binding protein [Neobacillus sp. DY30]WHY02903.1 ATP-binding protein [Neobacillus sp. DY30]
MKVLNPVPSQSEKHLTQLASVGQIAAGIAHEVRNPLTAVKGFLQLLEHENNAEYLNIAQLELENALTTLNDLLQVSKPDQEDEQPQSFLIAVEMESILNLFQDKIYDIQINTSYFDTNIPIYGKKNQFKKAFFNLIKNALESMNESGSLTISHFADGKEIVVCIEDTGVGIPDEKISLLGTPFFSTKDLGTGMGLTQVFSTVYQHGGRINVESEVNKGTKFTLRIPVRNDSKNRGVIKLNLSYEETLSIKEYFLANKDIFQDRLLEEAINVRDKIEEIHRYGNINLLSNAHKLVLLIVEEREHELISFAKQEGMAWAKYSLTIAFKLEWIQAIRRTVWEFLYNFDLNKNNNHTSEFYFNLEKNINRQFDQFLNSFFIQYSRYKDELLDAQRKLLENLSVPIIPISSDISILPLIGAIDSFRASTIEDKLITEIGNSHIHTLILDLSGAVVMEIEVIQHLTRVINGVSMMGCKTVITGLRPEIVKLVINSGITFEHTAELKGTLQVALSEYIGQNKLY